MSGPDVVRIKRKREETAPDALVVEQTGGKKARFEAQYVLQKVDATEPNGVDKVEQRPESWAKGKATHAPGSGLAGSPVNAKERRTFHLRRLKTPEAGIRKRRSREDDIATFIEKRVKPNAQEALDLAECSRPNSQPADEPARVLKRPGKGASIRVNGNGIQTMSKPLDEINNVKFEAMAVSLHQFALDEVSKESAPKRKPIAKPKMPPHRSRELHRQKMPTIAATSSTSQPADADVDMEEEGDYVYDTYILASSSNAGAAQLDVEAALGNVGYLVITQEDEAIWETYIEDEPSDKDWDTDEDDENAEDWYGADYPDEELASDDEFGRDIYRYCADDEEWDEDTGDWSDDEYERTMQPWLKKTPQQFSRYLNGAVADEGNEDE